MTKANNLVEASYKLTTLEQKIILSVISKLNVTDKEFQSYTLGIKEFCELLEIEGTGKYTQLRKITLGLQKKVFEIQIEDSIHQLNWFISTSYHKREGTVEFMFHPLLKPFLLELKNRFTSYSLGNVMKLKGSYAIRLYELLKQYEKIGERSFTLEDLRKKLGVDGSSYNSYSNLKARAILPAQEELAQQTDIQFDFFEERKGKRVIGIHFIIYKNLNVLQEKEEEVNELQQNIEKVRQYLLKEGLETEEKIIKDWLSHGLDRVMEILEYSITTKNITNPLGYTTWALKNDIKVKDLKKTRRGVRKEVVAEWLEDPSKFGQNSSMTQGELEEERNRLKEELKQYKK